MAKAFADLVGKGYLVLFPATEHAPFDLVAYREGTFVRVQVKYRTARDGVMCLQFRSTWADRHGTHTQAMDKGEVDLICAYCPETEQCYYLEPQLFKTSVRLRIAPSRNGQRLGIMMAEDFRDLPQGLCDRRAERSEREPGLDVVDGSGE